MNNTTIKQLQYEDKRMKHNKENLLTRSFLIRGAIALLIYASFFYSETLVTRIWVPIISGAFRLFSFDTLFMQLSNGSDETFNIYWRLYVNNFIYIILFSTIVPLFWKEIWEGLKKLKKGLWQIGTIVPIYFITILSSAALIQFLELFITIPDTSINQNAINETMRVAPLGNVFSTMVGAPFVEEIVFRAIIAGGLFMLLTTLFNRKNYKKGKEFFFKVIALIVATLLFAFLHVSSGDYLAVFPYIAMGLGMTFTYFMFDRNIVMPILLHILTNVVAFLANL